MKPKMKIVVLTGAGISAESGLGTFREKDGLWTKYDLAQVATPEGFAANPTLVHDFYNARRRNAAAAVPNAAHTALADLAKTVDLTLITQNVDDLHERARSPEVIHIHGALNGALCAACGARWAAPAVMGPRDPCPACTAPATRPDIVWFGEMPYHMDRAMEALADCDLFAAIGTSGEVYPAAGFVDIAANAGAQTVELNLEPSSNAAFESRIIGPASQVVPDWVRSLQ